MFKTDLFLGNKKLSLNQNIWGDHTTMQKDILLHFWVVFFIQEVPAFHDFWLQRKIMKWGIMNSGYCF